MIRLGSVAVHDDQWGSEEELWCYFCDKSVKKHQVYEGFTIEYLGYLTHLNDPKHFEAVKRYLRYHYRKEEAELFCKNKEFLDKFLAKIPEAKKQYLAKMDFIHEKDVAHMKEVEAKRQLLVSEALQVLLSVNENEAAISTKGSTEQTNTFQNISSERNSSFNPKQKTCPWLVQAEKNNDQQVLDKPVIGPTINVWNNYVAAEKKKMLPIKRLGANFRRKQVYSSRWLPAFSGVWNKGRRRQIKSNGKHTG
ncbi:Coiled-coil domain-containing protein 84 [Argiope bruennichi]|uniref:Coiled-coil domain-containing protein 84 n=2 Tax=Argiope bruennichi TaxID=94029 RepID=A0A8T0FMR1_ARGBR|nr:Coiled-coil domain-containing protein 84 [Argiope bruennichi]